MTEFWLVKDKDVDALIEDLARTWELSREKAANEAIVQGLLFVDKEDVLRILNE